MLLKELLQKEVELEEHNLLGFII